MNKRINARDYSGKNVNIPRLIVIMALIEALSGVTQGYINPILPALGKNFTISDPAISGLFVVSSLAFAVFTPIISRMGDIYGNRAILRLTTLVVAAGAVLMAVVPSLPTIYVGVVLITCVVGFVPLMTGIVRHYSPKHTRLAVSAMVGSLFLSLGTGALLAGLVGQQNPVNGFWVAVPFAILAVVGTLILPGGTKPSGGRLAILPMVTCSLGLTGFVIATSMGPEWGWLDLRTISAGVLGIGLIVAWVVIDSRVRNPFVNMNMFRNPQVRNISALTFFFGFTTISYVGINNIYLRSAQSTHGYGFAYDASGLALAFLGIAIVAFLTSIMTSRLLGILGEKWTLALAALLITSCFVLLLVFSTSQAGYLAGLFCLAAGMGIYQASTRALCVEAVPATQTATAAGINEMALTVGVAVGASVITMLASMNTNGGFITLSGFRAIWISMIAIAMLTTAISMVYKRATVSQLESNHEDNEPAKVR